MIARSDAGGSALDWMCVPLLELGEWVEALNQVARRDEKKKK